MIAYHQLIYQKEYMDLISCRCLPKEVFRLFNSIYCEDGEKILFCNKEELGFALTHQLQWRDIVIG